MTTNTLQIPHNIFGFLGFISRWLDQRQQRHADEKAIKAQLERERAERERFERLLFLKLLQTMCKVCEQLKPLPWVHTFNGAFYAGDVVRALPLDKGYDGSHTPIFEINHESPRFHGGAGAKDSANYYTIEIQQFGTNPGTIYNYTHCVPNDLIPDMQAVFDLAARRNMSSPERAATLKQLMDIDTPSQLPQSDKYQYPYDNIIGAIQYLESLLPQNQSK